MKLIIVGAVVACATLSAATASAQTPAKAAATPVTFTKDIAPILQRACQSCHRPGQMAPMSLLTYQDVRPWVRSIKQRVVSREMPPWGIDPHIGLQSFKNDPTLRPDEIEKIVKWVDGGAPMGLAADMPKPREFDNSDRWHIGKPDLIVTSPKHVVPPEASDWWGSYYVETGLTEDRYIKAIESKPGKTAVVHHLLTFAVDADASGDTNGDDSSSEAGEFLNEFAVGKNGDLFPEGTGRLLKAGAKIKFDFHYHSVGQEITDQSQLGIVLYPKGYTPKHIVYSKQLGQPTEPLDIPGGSTWVRSDGYTRFNKPGKITAFQPHMHTRGKRQC
ncbi:MAG: c-type cytochrome, partial [bacterium]